MDEKGQKFLDERIDLIASTVYSLEAVEKKFKNEQERFHLEKTNKIYILTDFAYIECGRIVLPNEEATSLSGIMIDTAINIRNMVLEKEENAHKNIINNVSTIIVEDATVYPYASSSEKIHYESLALFSNRITGITIGSEVDTPE